MFLRNTRRFKDGKEHRYWSIVESRRCAGGKVFQRPVLYLGEINDSQKQSWCRVLVGFDEAQGQSRQMALFPWDRQIPVHAVDIGIGVRLKDFSLHRPRQWGAYWLACELYRQLGLDEFWREKPWQKVRDGVEVKLHSEDGEMYVYARSRDRVAKERAMRLRQLRGLIRRLRELSEMTLPARELLFKLGQAQERYRNAWRLMDFELPEPARGKKAKEPARFTYQLNRDKLRKARRRAGRYLLRANMPEAAPADLWNFYIQLTEIEAAFKTLKDDLDLRPIYHQLDSRIEAHIFISFLAYCLHVTLRARLRPHAPGLTSRAVLDKFAAIQMLDVHFPTLDGRTLILSRYTQPEADQKVLLKKLSLHLPDQPPPRITSANQLLP